MAAICSTWCVVWCGDGCIGQVPQKLANTSIPVLTCTVDLLIVCGSLSSGIVVWTQPRWHCISLTCDMPSIAISNLFQFLWSRRTNALRFPHFCRRGVQISSCLVSDHGHQKRWLRSLFVFHLTCVCYDRSLLTRMQGGFALSRQIHRWLIYVPKRFCFSLI